jgi:cholesterol transport system auxiliary component
MHTYLLSDPIANVANHSVSRKTLMVTTSTSTAWLNTSQMVYELQPNQINYFAENQWAAPPAQLLQPILTHALQQSGLYKAVVAAPFAGMVSQRLDVNLLQMQQLFWQRPSIYLMTLQLQLINMMTDQPVAAKRLTIKIPAPADNPQGGVSAANIAVQQLLPQMVNFCRQHH